MEKRWTETLPGPLTKYRTPKLFCMIVYSGTHLLTMFGSIRDQSLFLLSQIESMKPMLAWLKNSVACLATETLQTITW